MTWSNVKLILFRELRDQMRDRRTLFSIVILPVLLYPLMGLLVMQVMQFRQQNPARLQIIGAAELPESPPLLDGPQFSPDLLQKDWSPEMFEIEIVEATIDPEIIRQTAQDAIAAGQFDALVYFPAGFAERVKQFQDTVNDEASTTDEFPQPQIYVNSAREKSLVARDRFWSILTRWRDKVIEQNLAAHDVPPEATNPFTVDEVDLSDEPERRSFLWSKIFPFIVVVWALTGAFYPAIDLCAGEKERGTLETLLSSPALRSEIVGGKLLAIMTFSIATSLLNLASMGMTATLVMGQLSAAGAAGRLNFGPPPVWSVGWLLLALIPMAALFSALALAVAALARSSKEGQYYLLPLLMVNLPLVILPILPSVEISMANSLIPVTGVLLLMKTLMEGNYHDALIYAPGVILVTATCIWLSIRWAIDQFNNESVLFSESERFDLRLWLVHLYRDRNPTPLAGSAVMAGLLILMIRYFAGPLFTLPTTGGGFVAYIVAIQVLTILLPVLAAAALLARDWRQTFLLKLPYVATIPAAILLAMAVHPFSIMLGAWVRGQFPVDAETTQQLQDLLAPALEGLPFVVVILLMAALPAVCEEFAFRGFILSGLRHMGHKWGAIVITALFFGATHGMLQQSINATIVGVLIGFLAVQSRSLFACMAYHVTHNSLAIGMTALRADGIEQGHWLSFLFRPTPPEAQVDLTAIVDQAFPYQPYIVGAAAIAFLALIYYFATLPATLSEEERLQKALTRQPAETASSRSTAKDAVTIEEEGRELGR
ncbi:ABC transporter permease subunit/CPBP intramembrane protease [Blastopirellula marina]|uniref:CPBP family intramembrane metalloprotease domain-containing protein n=1 Tax=Blastopirellula marina TaxID=124 RepID=A0A2S8GMU7_9BACT|nr:ABC transporter permease subunit/CPBP intramembrane protease [Blastopirellula marina]PQO45747.1 CPBP family intramembrane metalloprotease domain-containing protein [Blastopirellula marina]